MAAMPGEPMNRKVEWLYKKVDEFCRERGVYAPALVAFVFLVEAAQNHLVDQLESNPHTTVSKE